MIFFRIPSFSLIRNFSLFYGLEFPIRQLKLSQTFRHYQEKIQNFLANFLKLDFSVLQIFSKMFQNIEMAQNLAGGQIRPPLLHMYIVKIKSGSMNNREP